MILAVRVEAKLRKEKRTPWGHVLPAARAHPKKRNATVILQNEPQKVLFNTIGCVSQRFLGFFPSFHLIISGFALDLRSFVDSHNLLV